MKIVVLTNGSKHGLEIIRQLKHVEIDLQCIILEKKILRKKELDVFKSKLGKAAFAIPLIPFKNSFYRVFRKFKYVDTSARTLKNYCKVVHEVPNLTGKKCETILSSINPDVIVLGGSRIIKENILCIPRVGTLNAHPGMLPYYRGLDVIKWALYNGDKIGVTVHFVNSEIDSGSICIQEELQLDKNTSIQTIKDQAIKVSGRLMSKVVSEIDKFGEIVTSPNDLSKGAYYKTMSKDKNDELIIKLTTNE